MRVDRVSGNRSNALWGRGGRGLITALVVLALVAPAAASGGRGKAPRLDATYVSPSLQERAKRTPDAKLDVIIQASSVAGAERAFGGVGSLKKRLGLVNGVAVQVPAARLDALARIPGISVTPDSTVHLDAFNYSTQLWPYADWVAPLWGTPWTPAPQAPTIAIVDSGVQADRADLAGRVVADVNLTTLPNNSPGDGRGHGTMVAGLAAGGAAGYAGAAPNAKIVSLDVMDDSGMARTSDVIAAAQWILANKDAYNIRVANFSLHSATPSNFYRDPLDKAVEKLWFAGVTVVAAAGNYAVNGEPSGVVSAPGNDPFVITVGAADLRGTIDVSDDTIAPWSAYGYTRDGFSKPEVSAAGRYVVGPVPVGSTLYAAKPDHIVAPGYMQLSGTSFAAPVVAGAAAQILARHPGWTPNQVKGALMVSARPLPLVPANAEGVGEINAFRAATVSAPPNPNRALDSFVVADPAGGKIFDAVSWTDAASASVSWDSVSWTDVSWTDAAWSVVSWTDVSWTDVSWTDVSWTDISWSDLSRDDGAENDPYVAGASDRPLQDEASRGADRHSSAASSRPTRRAHHTRKHLRHGKPHGNRRGRTLR
jgi:serine protease AprX